MPLRCIERLSCLLRHRYGTANAAITPSLKLGSEPLSATPVTLTAIGRHLSVRPADNRPSAAHEPFPTQELDRAHRRSNSSAVS
jgi:hypothetical protein